MGTKFQEYKERKMQQYGEKFDTSDLNPAFVPYFENGKRIEVNLGYEVKRGRVGVTTGWKPSFLLMLTRRSIGSSYLISKDAKIIREV